MGEIKFHFTDDLSYVRTDVDANDNIEMVVDVNSDVLLAQLETKDIETLADMAIDALRHRNKRYVPKNGQGIYVSETEASQIVNLLTSIANTCIFNENAQNTAGFIIKNIKNQI